MLLHRTPFAITVLVLILHRINKNVYRKMVLLNLIFNIIYIVDVSHPKYYALQIKSRMNQKICNTRVLPLTQ